MPEMDTPVSVASCIVVVAPRPVKPCNWKFRRGSKMRSGSEGKMEAPRIGAEVSIPNPLEIIDAEARTNRVPQVSTPSADTGWYSLPQYRQTSIVSIRSRLATNCAFATS